MQNVLRLHFKVVGVCWISQLFGNISVTLPFFQTGTVTLHSF